MVLGRKTSNHFSPSAFHHRRRWNRINQPDGVFSAFAFAAGPIREAGVGKYFFPPVQKWTSISFPARVPKNKTNEIKALLTRILSS